MAAYQEIARKARVKVLKMIYDAQVSHIGSNFSCIDILTVLFEKADLTKDKIIFSKGWIAASAYYFLAEKGIIPKEDLEKFCKEDSFYIGLVEPSVKGIHYSGGSMGQGLPAAVGYALSKKLKKEEGKVYVLLSDGECQIGTFYESSLIAGKYKLDNLVVIADDNKLQALGKTNDILRVPWDFTEFHYHPNHYINGHNYQEIEYAIESSQSYPKFIHANTIKGKGVSFMENNNEWHYRSPEKWEYEKALEELR